MTKSAKIREIILEILEDKNWHNTEEFVKGCNEKEIPLEKGRGPIYTVIYRLKKQGLLESDEVGNYRRLEKTEEEQQETVKNIVAEKPEMKKTKATNKKVMQSIKVVENQLEELKDFDWISCTDSELAQARELAAKMLNLSKKIQSTLTNANA